MKKTSLKLDDRRLLALPGNEEETLSFAVAEWVTLAKESIEDHGFFAVALSGGSTPKKIFKRLAQMPNALDWSKVYLFWGDERSVPLTHPDSNYRMAIEESGLGRLPLLKENIFPMEAQSDISAHAAAYEALIKQKLGRHPFDLIMLGMGEDGHTASLFPRTEALHAQEKLVVANEVPQKKTWRMTFTYECINQARHICLYVLGHDKSEMVATVLTSPLNYEEFPSQHIGTSTHPALWILDTEASKDLLSKVKCS